MKKFLPLLFFLSLMSAPAATVRYASTNVFGQPDTNVLHVTPVGDPIQAEGSFITRGVPWRWTPNSSGICTTQLMQGNYVLSNTVLRTNIIFAVPVDTDTNTVYNVGGIGGLAISGFNTYNYSPGARTITGRSIEITNDGSGHFYITDTNAGSGGSASNVFFSAGQSTIWRTSGGSNVVDVVGTLTNATTGNAATATLASYVSGTISNNASGRAFASEDEVNAVDYGAVPYIHSFNYNPANSANGSYVTNPPADSTAAIQSALNAAGASGGRSNMVFLPKGIYAIGGFLSAPAGVGIRGVGVLHAGDFADAVYLLNTNSYTILWQTNLARQGVCFTNLDHKGSRLRDFEICGATNPIAPGVSGTLNLATTPTAAIAVGPGLFFGSSTVTDWQTTAVAGAGYSGDIQVFNVVVSGFRTGIRSTANSQNYFRIHLVACDIGYEDSTLCCGSDQTVFNSCSASMRPNGIGYIFHGIAGRGITFINPCDYQIGTWIQSYNANIQVIGGNMEFTHANSARTNFIECFGSDTKLFMTGTRVSFLAAAANGPTNVCTLVWNSCTNSETGPSGSLVACDFELPPYTNLTLNAAITNAAGAVPLLLRVSPYYQGGFDAHGGTRGWGLSRNSSGTEYFTWPLNDGANFAGATWQPIIFGADAWNLAGAGGRLIEQYGKPWVLKGSPDYMEVWLSEGPAGRLGHQRVMLGDMSFSTSAAGLNNLTVSGLKSDTITNSSTLTKVIGTDANGKHVGATLSNLTWDGTTLTAGGGGSATNAVIAVQTNGVAVLTTGATNINFLNGDSLSVTGGLSGSTVIIGINANSTLTRDAEWDTIAEIVTATGSDIVTNNRASTLTLAGNLTVAGTQNIGTMNVTNLNWPAKSNSFMFVGSDSSVVATNDAQTLTNLNASELRSGTAPTARLGSGSASSSTFLRGDSTWATPGGSGTVTASGGSLTANSVVLGAGTTDTKVSTGIITDGASQLTLGLNASTLGKLKLFGSTSGDATLQTPAVAGTATIVTMPNASSTLPIFGQQITFAGPTAARTVTLPDAAFTAARTDAAQTFTGVQSMTSPDITTSITTATTSFTLLAGATTLLTIGGTGASASMFAPSTLDATTSTTGAIRTSGGISAAKAANIGTSLIVGTAITSSNLTASRIVLSGADKTLVSAAGSGVVPIDADGSLTTFAQINTLAASLSTHFLTNNDVNLITLTNVNLGATNTPGITVTNASFTFKKNGGTNGITIGGIYGSPDSATLQFSDLISGNSVLSVASGYANFPLNASITGNFTNTTVGASKVWLNDANSAATGVSVTGSGNVMRTRTGVIRTWEVPMGTWWTNGTAVPATLAAWTNSSGDAWLFADAVTNDLRVRFALPGAWDASTVQWQFTMGNTLTNTATTQVGTNVVFGIKAASIGSGQDEGNLTFGTEINFTNRLSKTNWWSTQNTTPAITVGNSPAALKDIVWAIRRITGDTGDATTNAVSVIHARIIFTETTTEPTAPAATN